ncbi:MAG: FAD-binding protein, partial [Dehalococcoidia bacterium]|nr:FAD-binding protein [Dehalococcoidia bacterium]
MDPIEIEADVLVVGGGLAGCWAAIRASDCSIPVVLVDKARVSRSGASTFAAGVMLAPQAEDDLAAWREEIVKAGDYLNDQDWVDVLLKEQVERIDDMARWGFPFERDDGGRLIRTVGRGHHNSRILMFHGKKPMEQMRRQCLKRGVRLLERIMVTDILTSDGKHPTQGRVVGALGVHTRTGQTYLFKCKALVMAAGAVGVRKGCGFVDNVSGDGVAAAFRAGAQLTGMEFCVCTNIAVWQRKYMAGGINMIQGSGARIVNARGERFMEKYDPVLLERARTHVLGKAFAKEVLEGRGPIYVDMRHFPSEVFDRFRRVIPKTMQVFDAAGIDPSKEMVECTPSVGCPASWSCNGGIRVSLQCETTLPGLLAAGSCTKALPHGTYAVGGLNLAYCCVSGHRAGDRAAQLASVVTYGEPDGGQVGVLLKETLGSLDRKEGPKPDELTERIRSITTPAQHSFFKHEKRIRQVIDQLDEI